MSVTIDRTDFHGWAATRIARPPLELLLVPQVGGRIMGLRWRGHDLAFTQPERRGAVEDVEAVTDVRARKQALGFPLWGGDKTWLAPQNRWQDGVPFLDLDSGPYALRVDDERPERVAVTMTSRVCRETEVELSRQVVVTDRDAGWVVTHALRNAGARSVQWGLWDVSMLARPARVYLPRSDTSYFPEGVHGFKDEGDTLAVRSEVVEELGTLAVVRCDGTRAFKFGTDPDEGWMVGLIDVAGHGLVGYRKQVPVQAEASYGHGCVVEVYNSATYPYFEMEIHGPITRLAPGERATLEERQALVDVERWPEREADVRRLLA